MNSGHHGGYVQRAYVTRGGHVLLLADLLLPRRLPRRCLSRLRLGRTYVLRLLPGVWYHPGFYGWGYHPWGAPVYLGYWGMGMGRSAVVGILRRMV